MSHRRRRRERFPSPRPPRVDRKTLQLCRQIADTLNYVLSGELNDDVLRNVYVDSVQPAPDASRLLVSVALIDPNDSTPADKILHRLGLWSPRIRSEVAHSIHRRKTPELSYCVVRPEAPEAARPTNDAQRPVDDEDASGGDEE
jgi:ribosome-binding factor A